MGTRGTWHVLHLLPTPPQAKFAIPNSPEDEWYAATEATALTNLLFFSWLLYDVLHVIIAFPALGGMDTVLHHLGFLGASLICGSYRILPFPFAWLLAGELSTIALNIRWVLINTNRGNSNAMQVANVAFALAFFAVRILGYGAGLVHLWARRAELFSLAVPPPHLYLVLVLLVGGYLLNLLWFRKIYDMATRSGSAKRKDR